MAGTVYLNVRTNALVQSFGEGPVDFTVATLTENGPGRRRTVRAAFFHDDFLARDGRAHMSGYVPVSALPVGHPHSTKKEPTRVDLIDMLDKMSDAELAKVILEQEKVKKEAADIADRAKMIAKSRRGGTLGTEVHGGIALVYTSGVRFDAALAKRNLSPEDFKRILVRKADATLAKKIFEGEPEKLALCQKDNGPTLSVRPSTAADEINATGSEADSGEDFVIEWHG